MAQRSVVKAAIGMEDLKRGTGTFSRLSSTGTLLSISEIGMLHSIRYLADFNSLSDAIDDLPVTGGTIIVGPGTHDISDTVGKQVSVPLSLIGIGGRDTVILDGGATSGVFNTVGFDIRANVSLRGIQFKNMGSVVFLSNNSAILGHVDIQECQFVNCGSGAYWNSPIAGSGVARVTIIDNIVDTCDRGFHLGASFINDALIQGNRIRTVKRKGIKVGYTNTENQTVENVRIHGNYIDGVTDPTGINGVYDCNAIDVQGRYGSIIGNVVRNVTTGSKDDSEGIYTKCIQCSIIGNTLIDAGENQGAINIKGGDRAGNGSGPDGYAVVVQGNTILNVNNTGAQGINIACDDVLVEGNLIEGQDGRAIKTSSDGTLIFTNLTIRGNKCRGQTGSGVISLQFNGTGLVVEDNEIEGLDGSTTTTTPTFGISLSAVASASPGANEVRIRRNKIRSLTATDSRAIWLVKDSTDTVTDVIVEDNDIDGAEDAGIALSGDTAIASIRITGNRIVNVTDANRDIVRTGTADYSAAGAIIENNYGDFVNSNRGQATLLDTGGPTATTVIVTHGLSTVTGIGSTPLAQDIIVHPIESLGSASFWWVDTITATTFTINVNADPGQDVDFAWQVNRRLWQQ